MQENTINMVNITCYISLAFLTFICFLDFRKNIPRPKHVLPFFVALFLFLIANAVVYIGLLSFIAGIEINFKNYTFFWGGGDNIELFRYRKISPLIIAVLYFGFGKAKLEIGNKEFALYEIMLNIFRSMFPLSLGASKKLNEYIDKLGDETDKLNQTINNLIIIAENYNWILFDDEWKEINRSQKLIEDDVEFLMKIKSSLSKEHLNDNEINGTKDDIIRQIEKLRLELNEKLRNYLKKIISKNIVHEKAIEEIVTLIDVKKSDDIIVKKRPNYIARAFGISFLCSILLSIVYAISGSNYAPTHRILYFVVSFFFFLSIFTLINKIPNSIEGFSYSLIIGSFGGFCGHLAWLFISKTILLNEIVLTSFDFYMALINKTALGIILGAVSAGIAFVYKHKVNEKIERFFLKYLLISITGGILFLCIFFLFGYISIDLGQDYRKLFKFFLTGCITLLGISFVSGIFEKIIPKVEKEIRTIDINTSTHNNTIVHEMNSSNNNRVEISSYPPGG